MLEVAQSETGSARVRPRRDVAPARAPSVPRARPTAGRRHLGVRARRRVFPRQAAPSQGCYTPLETLDAGNASHTEPPYAHAKDQRSVPPTSGCARPQVHPPPVRRSLGGAQVALKREPRPWPRCTLASSPNRAVRRRQQAAASSFRFQAGRVHQATLLYPLASPGAKPHRPQSLPEPPFRHQSSAQTGSP
jgi:hypothetical protein